METAIGVGITREKWEGKETERKMRGLRVDVELCALHRGLPALLLALSSCIFIIIISTGGVFCVAGSTFNGVHLFQFAARFLSFIII